MRHQKIKKMLSTFMDGRLSSGEELFLKEHISNCDECRMTLNSFIHVRKSVHEQKVKVNPFFASRVLADLKSRQREAFWNVFDLLPRPVVVTGLTLAIITLAVFATPYSPLRETTTSTSEFAMLYGDQTDITPVTDDEALAIAINAEIISNGE